MPTTKTTTIIAAQKPALNTSPIASQLASVALKKINRDKTDVLSFIYILFIG